MPPEQYSSTTIMEIESSSSSNNNPAVETTSSMGSVENDNRNSPAEVLSGPSSTHSPKSIMDEGAADGSLPNKNTKKPLIELNNPGGQRVDTPLENDVLCGRGGNINSHSGNEQFRTLVEQHKRVYLTARFKREKRMIANSIVSEIRNKEPSGRFLAKMHKDDVHWTDIGDEKARDKTSQALRENAPTLRAEMETELLQQQREKAAKEHPYPPQHAGAGGVHPHQAYWDWYYTYYYGRPAPPMPVPPPGAAASHHPYPPVPPPGAAMPPPPPHGQHSHAHPHYPYPPVPPPPHMAAAGGAPPPGYPVPPPPAGGYPYPPPPPPPGAGAAAAPQQQQQHASAPAAPTPYWQPPVQAASNEEYKQADDADANMMQEEQNPLLGSTKPSASHSLSSTGKRMRSAVVQAQDDETLAMELQHQERLRILEQRQRRAAAQRNSARGCAHARPKVASSASLFSQQQQQQQTPQSPHNVASMPPHLTANLSAPDDPNRELTQEELDHRLAVALQNEEDQVIERMRQQDRHNTIGRSNAHAPSMFSSWVKSFNGSDAKPSATATATPDNQSMPPPPGRYDPLPASTQESTQQHSQHQQNPSLLSQFANSFLGSTLGSWDQGSTSHSTSQRQQPLQQPPTSPIQQPQSSPTADNTEGLEVQLVEDHRQEESYHQQHGGDMSGDDWSSRVGSCNGWEPMTFFANSNHGDSKPPATSSGNNNDFDTTISPVMSLDMDCSISTGGGSFGNMFPGIGQVPSWERSCRSKSPSSMRGGGEPHQPELHVRHQMDKFQNLMDGSDGNGGDGMDWQEAQFPE